MRAADYGPILVIGATGNQGGQVARALLAAGQTVQAFTRTPQSPPAQSLKAQGAHLVSGDLSDRKSLNSAFHAVSGVFSVQNFWDLGLAEEVRLGVQVVEAAMQASHRLHLIYSSGLGAESPQKVAAIDGKGRVEQHLRNSGLPFTILRPGLFMDDFRGASLPFARPIQRLLRPHRHLVGRLLLATLRAVVPEHPIPLTTLSDLGSMAAWAFQHPHLAQGRTYSLVGSSETTGHLVRLWEQYQHESIPHLVGVKWGIRLAHPQMAALLDWLGQYDAGRNGDLPIPLQSFTAWLKTLS